MERKGSTSPSILSGQLYEKKDDISTKKEVGTQTINGKIIDAMIYRKHIDKTTMSIKTDILHKVDFHDQRPLDQRNENFARLVAFELERVPIEKRSNLYPQILNIIRIFRGDSNLDECIEFVPIMSDSDDYEERVLPLNVRYERNE